MLQQVKAFTSTLPRLRRVSALFAAKKYCVNVNLYVKPERREEFLRVIRINAQGTRSQVNHAFIATSYLQQPTALRSDPTPSLHPDRSH